MKLLYTTIYHDITYTDGIHMSCIYQHNKNFLVYELYNYNYSIILFY